MTIKQLEQELEIPRATIRFYEKENLIAPKRGDNSYREYSEEDVETLKKIIILRKIGFTVADIKNLLDGNLTLQPLLEKNISELQNQIKELEGAINVCKIMQNRNEEVTDLDTCLYWNEIEEQEKAGFKFKEILNDVITFEKGVVLKELQLANDNGDLLFDGDFKTGFLRAAGFCIFCGFVWYLLEGQDRTFHNFLEGFFWPFLCIFISSLLGLPVHFIEKKNPALAKKIRKFGERLAIVFTICLLIIAFLFFLNK